MSFFLDKSRYGKYIYNLLCSIKYFRITGSNHTLLDGAGKVLNNDVGLNGDGYITCSKHLKDLREQFYVFKKIFSSFYSSLLKMSPNANDLVCDFLISFMPGRTYRTISNISYFTWFPVPSADHMTLCLQYIYCQV